MRQPSSPLAASPFVSGKVREPAGSFPQLPRPKEPQHFIIYRQRSVKYSSPQFFFSGHLPFCWPLSPFLPPSVPECFGFMSCVQILTPFLLTCVTLGKLMDLSVPRVLICEVDVVTEPPLTTAGKIPGILAKLSEHSQALGLGFPLPEDQQSLCSMAAPRSPSPATHMQSVWSSPCLYPTEGRSSIRHSGWEGTPPLSTQSCPPGPSRTQATDPSVTCLRGLLPQRK